MWSCDLSLEFALCAVFENLSQSVEPALEDGRLCGRRCNCKDGEACWAERENFSDVQPN